MDLLWQRLDATGDETSFAKVGTEIVANWRKDASVSMERDERAELGRRAVLDVVIDVCERAPELDSDWYAVSAQA